MFDLKLVAYEPNGDRIGVLPQPLSIESADPLSDTPSLQLQYSKFSVGAELLSRPIEIAREVYDPNTQTWIEPPNSRFILIRTEGDRMDQTGVMEYIAPGYSWMLNKVQVYPIQKSIIDGQVADATGTEASKRTALNSAEDSLAQSMGLSTNRPVAYQENSPSAQGSIWVEVKNSTVLSVGYYNTANNSWTKLTTSGPMAAARSAWTAYVAHQESQGQLRDVQGRAKLTRRTFTGMHAGQVFHALLTEAIGRGGRLSGMTLSFDGTADSAGNAWPASNASIEISTGTNLMRVLQNFVSSAQLDFRTNGRELQVYLQDTAMKRDNTANVQLRYGQSIDEAPDRATWEQLANEVLFLGEDGLNFTKQNPEAPAPWGTWETTVSQSNVDSEATGTVLAKGVLEETSGLRVERTRALIFKKDQPNLLPYVHYLPGDSVLAPNSEGVLESQRIEQITLTKDGETGQVAGNIVLHDRFLEREVRNQRTLEAVVGGGTVGGTGGTRNPETYIDLRTPEAPRYLELAADTQLTKDAGYQTLVGATWWWSRRATNGTPMDGGVAHFDVDYRLYQEGTSSSSGIAYSWRNAGRASGDAWSLDFGPVDTYSPVTGAPAIYQVRVRAYGLNGKVSSWSTPALVQVPVDDVPPVQPSRPSADVEGSLIIVKWNGKNKDGGNAPLDFAHCRVEEAVIPSDAPIVDGALSDSFVNALPWADASSPLIASAPGSSVVTRRPYKVNHAYRLVAVDLQGNESTPSLPSNLAAPVPLVDTDKLNQDLAQISHDVNEDLVALQGELDTAEATLLTHEQTQALLRTDLTTANSEISAAKSRLSTAETSLTTAHSEIDSLGTGLTAAELEIAAAETRAKADAKAKADAAEAAAIAAAKADAKAQAEAAESRAAATAAADAQAKADAAETAALEAAKIYADLQANDAGSDALEAAKADATAKADAARQAAIDAAALDATAKAEAAESAAAATAAADATAKADQAKADAITAAAITAQQKADLAEQAAKTAAAADATAKAEQAEADAIAAAALDAKTKADKALADAKTADVAVKAIADQAKVDAATAQAAANAAVLASKDYITDPTFITGADQLGYIYLQKDAGSATPLNNAPIPAPATSWALARPGTYDCIGQAFKYANEPGRIYQIDVDAIPSSLGTPTANFSAGVWGKRADGTNTYELAKKPNGDNNAIPASVTTWTHFRGTVKVPADATYWSPWVRNGGSNPGWIFTNLHIRDVTDAQTAITNAATAHQRAVDAEANAKADATLKADAARQAAIDAAALDATAKAEQAEADAAAAAALDATAKANAARQAAIDAAAQDATNKAATAKQAAIDAAALDATAKAEAAEAAAAATAAVDAAAKADAAEAAALAAAKTYAEAQASGAGEAALTAAKADATAKADAAELAAKTAAAADATAKAEQAEADAIAAAAADATSKASAAQSAAIAAAETTAKAFADAAETAAKNAAALDATAKAEQAEADAVAAAAADAKAKADQALIDAKAADVAVKAIADQAKADALAAQQAADRAAAQAVNAIADPSFEARVNGTALSAGWHISDTGPRTGKLGLRRTTGPSGGWLIAPNVPVMPGQTWRISAWHKTTADYNGTANWGKLRIGIADGAQGGQGTLIASPIWYNTQEWTQRSYDYVVPADGSVSGITVAIGGDNTAGTIWVDDVEVKNITDVLAAEAAAKDAKDRAILAEQNAAADAKAKADAAEAAAIAAAALDATAKAEQAEADAVAAAAITAQEKADAAKQTAIEAAALDATSKAAAAQAAAEAKAATAQTAADKAHAAALEAARSVNNWVVNPGFEQGFTGWYGSPEGLVTDTAYEGTQSWSMASASQAYQAPIPVTAGQVWRMELMLKTVADYGTQNGGIRLEQSTNGGSSWGAAAQTNFTASETWRREVAADYTVPAGVTHIRARIGIGVITKRFWVDNVKLTEVSALKTLEAAAAKAQTDASKALTDAGTAQSTATSALNSANGKSSVFYSLSAPSGTGTRDGDIWFQTDGTNVIGQWSWSSTFWKKRDLTHSVIASVDAAKISVGTLSADRIAAGSISAAKLLVTDNTNLWPDPDFKDPLGTTSVSIYPGTPETVPHGRTAILLNRRDHVIGRMIAVHGGEKFRMTFTGKNLAGTARLRASLWIYKNAAGQDGQLSTPSWRWYSTLSTTSNLTQLTDLGDGWGKWTGTVEVPPQYLDVGFAKLYFQLEQYDPWATSWLISDIEWRRMNGGELIVDGAITTPKLTVTEDMSAAMVNAMTVAAKKLVVTDEAVMQAATITRLKSEVVQATDISTDKLVAGSATINTAVISKLFADMFTANKITANQLQIGAVGADGLIADNAVTATKIAEGAVTTNHMLANTIEGDRIKVNTITADRLDVASVKAAVVTSDALYGKTIEGGVIKGSTFRTHDSNFEGILIFSNATGTGMRMTSTSGERVFDFDANSAVLKISGRTMTGTPGNPGINITSAEGSYNGDDQGIWFTRDGTGYGWGNPDHKPVGGVFMTKVATGNSEDIDLQLRPGGNGWVRIHEGIRLSQRYDVGGNNTIVADGELLLIGGEYQNASMRLRSKGGRVYIGWSDTTSGLSVFLGQGSGYPWTTTAGGNLYINSSGQLLRSTSRADAKLDAREYKVPESVLQIPVKDWYDRSAVEQIDRFHREQQFPLKESEQHEYDALQVMANTRIPGVIAEEAAALGAENLVIRDDRGEINSFDYGKLGALLLPFVRELWEDYKARNQ